MFVFVLPKSTIYCDGDFHQTVDNATRSTEPSLCDCRLVTKGGK